MTIVQIPENRLPDSRLPELRSAVPAAGPPAGRMADWADDLITFASLAAIGWFVGRRAIAWWRATPEPPRRAPRPAQSAGPAGTVDVTRPDQPGQSAQAGADPLEDPLSTRAF